MLIFCLLLKVEGCCGLPSWILVGALRCRLVAQTRLSCPLVCAAIFVVLVSSPRRCPQPAALHHAFALTACEVRSLRRSSQSCEFSVPRCSSQSCKFMFVFRFLVLPRPVANAVSSSRCSPTCRLPVSVPLRRRLLVTRLALHARTLMANPSSPNPTSESNLEQPNNHKNNPQHSIRATGHP